MARTAEEWEAELERVSRDTWCGRAGHKEAIEEVVRLRRGLALERLGLRVASTLWRDAATTTCREVPVSLRLIYSAYSLVAASAADRLHNILNGDKS